MISIDFKIDLQALFKSQATLEVLRLGGLPHTKHAVQESLKFIKNTWSDIATKEIKYSTGNYVQAIQIEYGGEYSGQVVNRLPYAGYVEYGVSSFDMKKMLSTSHQVRVSKKGIRYLIIPFRHMTPGEHTKQGAQNQRATAKSMPKNIYDLAKSLAKSNVTGTYHETSKNIASPAKARNYKNGIPQAQRWKYNWGQRLTGIGGIHEGMVKMNTTGGGSQYLTFRVMSQKSRGWIHPGIEAKHLTQKTVAQVSGKINSYLEENFNKDISEIRQSGQK